MGRCVRAACQCASPVTCTEHTRAAAAASVYHDYPSQAAARPVGAPWPQPPAGARRSLKLQGRRGQAVPVIRVGQSRLVTRATAGPGPEPLPPRPALNSPYPGPLRAGPAAGAAAPLSSVEPPRPQSRRPWQCRSPGDSKGRFWHPPCRTVTRTGPPVLCRRRHAEFRSSGTVPTLS